MRRGLIAVVLVLGALVPVGAGAQASSGIGGTVLDTTCTVGCAVECPPPPVCRSARICAQPQAPGRIVCPLTRHGGAQPLFCTQAGCPGPPIVKYPPYEGTVGTVILRRAGSATVLRKLPIVEGKFSAALAPGRYVLRAHVAEPCWTGTRAVVEVSAGRTIPAILPGRQQLCRAPRRLTDAADLLVAIGPKRSAAS